MYTAKKPTKLHYMLLFSQILQYFYCGNRDPRICLSVLDSNINYLAARIITVNTFLYLAVSLWNGPGTTGKYVDALYDSRSFLILKTAVLNIEHEPLSLLDKLCCSQWWVSYIKDKSYWYYCALDKYQMVHLVNPFVLWILLPQDRLCFYLTNV